MATAALDSSKANRRFILLAVVLGLLGAVLVYVVLNRDTGSGGSVAGDTAVVVAKIDIPARTRVTADMLSVKLVPADTVSELSFTEPSQVVGQYTRFAIVANEHVLSSKVLASAGSAGFTRALSYTIPAGKRAIAIQVSELSQVGGLLLPGDYVDILGAFTVEFGDDTQEAYVVRTIFQNIEVLAVAQAVVDTVGTAETDSATGQRARNSEGAANAEASTVTLALTPEQAQTIFLAERHAELRLALRPFGDGTEKPINFMAEPDLLPPGLPAPPR